MFLRTKKRAGKIYLQLVENKWVDGRTKQRMLKSLGRLDVLQSTGQLDGLLRSGMKFSERLAVLDAHDHGRSLTTKTHRIGPAMIFEKLSIKKMETTLFNAFLLFILSPIKKLMPKLNLHTPAKQGQKIKS